jgi:hypothetical protein
VRLDEAKREVGTGDRVRAEEHDLVADRLDHAAAVLRDHVARERLEPRDQDVELGTGELLRQRGVASEVGEPDREHLV